MDSFLVFCGLTANGVLILTKVLFKFNPIIAEYASVKTAQRQVEYQVVQGNNLGNNFARQNHCVLSVHNDKTL